MRNQVDNFRREPGRRKMLLLLMLPLAALALALGGYLETRGQMQERCDVAEDIGQYKSLVYQGTTYVQKTAVETYLLMGVDTSAQDTAFGARRGGQADFFLLLTIDHANRTIYQLQLDRDTMAEVQVYGVLGNRVGAKRMQLCLSHGFGSTAQENNRNAIDAVCTLLNGIPVDQYITFHLEAIGVLNDALGGVTVTLEDDFTDYDPEMTDGETLRLNAAQAEIFTRYRMEVGDGSNESRMARQRVFLCAASGLLKERMKERPGFIGELYDDCADVMTTNSTKGQMIHDINMAYSYVVQPVETLPGEHWIDDAGFMAFTVQEGAVMQWVLRVYYQPAG